MSASVAEPTEAREGEYLLRLFREDVERRLIAGAVAAAREAMDRALVDMMPAIEQAAKDAVASMEPSIRTHHDNLREELVIQFVGKVSA